MFVRVLRTRKGELEVGAEVPCRGPEEATRRAERAALSCEGAIAFSRTGDPEHGEYGDPVVLKTFGAISPTILARISPVPF